jgi:IrrE N-terminal-like domain
MESVFEIIQRYWDRAPVDVVGIIHDADILYSEEPLGDVESGRIDKWGGGFRIIVNSEHSLVRRRFTAAHELGHYAFHRDLIGDGHSDIAYRTSDQGKYHNKRIGPKEEATANQFAATLLMPKNLITRLSLERNISLPLRIAEMARLLEVSEAALRVRLGRSSVTGSRSD